MRVTPLIKTTEDLLKVRNEEMVVLRQKLEKVEAERNQLMAQNTQMNYQVSELWYFVKCFLHKSVNVVDVFDFDTLRK